MLGQYIACISYEQINIYMVWRMHEYCRKKFAYRLACNRNSDKNVVNDVRINAKFLYCNIFESIISL